MTFGQNIVAVRKKRGLTRQELGERIGVDKRLGTKYEKDQPVPSV
jgi:transcriptional regulator with XRE-family HTH domain